MVGVVCSISDQQAIERDEQANLLHVPISHPEYIQHPND